MKTQNSFDPVNHQYFIAGRLVPSVTQVLKEILGDAIWQSSDWYLERGRAVHACAALIAQGKRFEHDPQITGQLAACRKFFFEMKPEVLEVEIPVYSEIYQFAGTFDLLAIIGGKKCLVDWKSVLSPAAEIQLGGYAVAVHSVHPDVHHGMVVSLNEDGTYKTGGMIKLDRLKNEFLGLRSAYATRQRLGLIKSKEVENQ